MSESEDLIKSVLLRKCETPTLEVKAALNGTPKVYDTLSSFSNQIDGGDIVFGIDEKSGFSVTGVYDAQKLQKDLHYDPVFRGKHRFQFCFQAHHKTPPDTALKSRMATPTPMAILPAVKKASARRINPER